jgi:hypothetical protein
MNAYWLDSRITRKFALPSIAQLLLSTVCTVACLTGCGQNQQRSKNPLASSTAKTNAVVRGHAVTREEELGKTIVAIVSVHGSGQALCTGTILAEDTILTAAHCVDDSPEKLAIVFSEQLKKADENSTRFADRMIQNPSWPNGGDLALIHFQGGLPQGYQPVQLVPAKFAIEDGQEVIMAGYGVTNGLTEKGAGTLREMKTTVVEHASDSLIVTDGKKSSVCFGDSGGPAFVKKGERFLQWGVASSVVNKACNQASVHTSLMGYSTWIKSAARQLRGTEEGSSPETASSKPHKSRKKKQSDDSDPDLGEEPGSADSL